MTMQRRIRATMMRGGTSRALYFEAKDMPEDPAVRDAILLAAMGSPDPRQIDGVGGATFLTSKNAIISPSKEEGVDVDYFFCQVTPDRDTVDTAPTCGNILAGVGPFAVERGIVPARDGETRVRIRAVNTGDLIESVFKTPGGQVEYEGDTAIDGVPGTASPILLNFMDCLGSKTGKLFPTGNVVDVIDGIEVTLADAAMPVMMMRAEAMGKTGYETVKELDADKDLFARLEPIRRKAGLMMGFGDVADKVIPKPVLLAQPRAGGTISSRYFTPHSTHEAHAVTGAVCVACATLSPGTVGHQMVKPAPEALKMFTIEHPAGTIDVAVTMDLSGAAPAIKAAGILRTARLLFDGTVFVAEGKMPKAAAAA
jgi:4-oxalomesaconate tautomerase